MGMKTSPIRVVVCGGGFIGAILEHLDQLAADVVFDVRLSAERAGGLAASQRRAVARHKAWAAAG
jgi:hypothetical protein